MFGDFDLDGISAAAVATRGLAALGATVEAIVPHRFREGYGLTAAAIERVVVARPDLVVTVDCGISSAAEVAALRVAGDRRRRHRPPRAGRRGAPRRSGRQPQAGRGVSCRAIWRARVSRSSSSRRSGRALATTDAWRELADLGDAWDHRRHRPVAGENRALVADGVAAVRRAPECRIAALCAVAGVRSTAFSADNVAFASPRGSMQPDAWPIRRSRSTCC